MLALKTGGKVILFRQSCVLSFDVFNLYSETILQELADMLALKTGGKVILFNLRLSCAQRR